MSELFKHLTHCAEDGQMVTANILNYGILCGIISVVYRHFMSPNSAIEKMAQDQLAASSVCQMLLCVPVFW